MLINFDHLLKKITSYSFNLLLIFLSLTIFYPSLVLLGSALAVM